VLLVHCKKIFCSSSYEGFPAEYFALLCFVVEFYLMSRDGSRIGAQQRSCIIQRGKTKE
jgi:hypothetical protein